MLGKRFRPLANSKRYAPKKWVENSEGVYCEVEVTALDRFESELAWDDPANPWERTTPITEADAEADPAVRDYVGGFAIFPKVENVNESTPEGRVRKQAQADAWQARAEKMHDRQTILSLEAKPTDDNALTRKFQVELERGD